MIKSTFRHFFTFTVIALALAGCDNLGSRKIKNIVELSTRLSSNNTEVVKLYPQIDNIDSSDIANFKPYIVAKSKIIAEPLFAKGIMYSVDSKGNANAFSMKDRKLLWTSELDSKSSYNFDGGGIAAGTDRLYLTNGSRYLIVINRSNGNELFRKEFPDIIKIKPVILRDDIIIVQTVGNQVFAYDTANSRLVWQHEGPQEILSSTNHAAPIVVRNQVLVNYSSGFLVSLDKSGAERWAISLSREQEIGLPNFEQSSIVSDPLISDEYAYLAVANGRVLKVNIDDGQIAWQAKVEDTQTITLNNEHILITTNARQLAVINKIDGRIISVGELEIAGNKRSKIIKFLNPIVTKKNNVLSVNVASNSSSMYSFEQSTEGKLMTTPLVKEIRKNIRYSGMTCCNKLYFITDKEILLARDK